MSTGRKKIQRRSGRIGEKAGNHEHRPEENSEEEYLWGQARDSVSKADIFHTESHATTQFYALGYRANDLSGDGAGRGSFW